jgi:hypothetical protein
MDGFFLIIKTSVCRNKAIVYTSFYYYICHTRNVNMFRPKLPDRLSNRSVLRSSNVPTKCTYIYITIYVRHCSYMFRGGTHHLQGGFLKLLINLACWALVISKFSVPFILVGSSSSVPIKCRPKHVVRMWQIKSYIYIYTRVCVWAFWLVHLTSYLRKCTELKTSK